MPRTVRKNPTSPTATLICTVARFEKPKIGVARGMSPLAGALRQCAQCNGTIDGTERVHAFGGREVWLHTECKHFWLVSEGLEQRW